jgi:hypothetical protein
VATTGSAACNEREPTAIQNAPVTSGPPITDSGIVVIRTAGRANATAFGTARVLRRPSARSLIDFVPDREPYEHMTEVELTPVDGGTRVVMDVEPLHDDVWTERLLAGRNNELDNLTAVLERRG